jgi:hypothetical protein
VRAGAPDLARDDLGPRREQRGAVDDIADETAARERAPHATLPANGILYGSAQTVVVRTMTWSRAK